MIEDYVDFEDTPSGIGSDEMFDCEFSSIDEVINKPVIYTGFKFMNTENGERLVVAYSDGNTNSAFFTDSKGIRQKVTEPERKYPFRAIIKVVRFGDGYGFKFFSPTSPITEQDNENYNYYKKYKFKRNGRNRGSKRD